MRATRRALRRQVAIFLIAALSVQLVPARLLAFDAEFDTGHQRADPVPPGPVQPTGVPGQGKPPDGDQPGEDEPECICPMGRPILAEEPDDLDAPATQPGEPNTVEDPINLYNGNFSTLHHDLYVPARGLPLKVARVYNSFDRVEGAFGVGWQSIFSVALFPTTDGSQRFAVVRLSNGDRISFPANQDGTYSSPSGDRNQLSKTLSGWDLTRPWKVVYRFDVRGRLAQIVDRNQNSLTFSRDERGRVTKIDSGTGRALAVSYTTANKVASIVDPSGRVFRYGYDSWKNLTAFTDPSGQTLRYSYDPNHRLTCVTDERGNPRLTNTYDAGGRVTAQTHDGGTYAYAYNGNPPTQTVVTDPLGRQSTYAFDAAGRLLSRSSPDAGTRSQIWNSQGLVSTVAGEDGGLTQYQYDAAGNVTQVRDAAGRTTSYQYDAASNRLLRATDALGLTATYSYDARGNRVMQSTPTGLRFFEYDANGNLVRHEAALDLLHPSARTTVETASYDQNGDRLTRSVGGLTDRYRYDTAGRTTSIVDPVGATTRFEYDRNGNLARSTDALGRHIDFTHDDAGNLTSIQDAEGRLTRFSYDRFNRWIQTTDASGHTRSVTYDALGNRATEADERGSVTSYAYDRAGRLIAISDAAGGVTRFEYSAAGLLTAAVDRRGNRTTFAFDQTGRLTRRTDALGRQLALAYDAAGRLSGITNSLGGITAVSVNVDGALSAALDPAGTRTSYRRDGLGRVVAASTGNDPPTTFAYDARGLPTQFTNGMGQSTRLRYDDAGNLTGAFDSAGASFVATYDLLGQLENVRRGSSELVRYEYDRTGLPKQVLDSDGQLLRFDYDGAGNVTDRTDALGRVAHCTYDAAGNCTAFRSPRGFETTFGYDLLNRLQRITDPAGGSEVFQYDSEGNPTAVTNAAGETTALTLDALNRESTRVLAGGNVIRFQYDVAGNVSRVTDSVSNLAFTYDQASRTLTALASTAFEPTSTISYAYDSAGRRRTLTYPGGGVKTLRYDAAGRFSGTDPASSSTAISITYDGGSRPASVQLGSVIRCDYAYDDAGRVSSISQRGPGDISLLQLSYSYTLGGLVATETEDGSRHSYAYDLAGELTTASHPAGQTFNPAESFTYDADSNRTSGGASYDGRNALVGDALYSYSYDAAGRRTERRSKSASEIVRYAYDSDDRLTEVDVLPDGSTVSHRYLYAYDGFGRRIRKTLDGAVTRYVYDESNLIALVDAAGNPLVRYVYSDGVDAPVAMVSGGQTFFYLKDRLSSVRRVVRSDGVVVNRYTYSAFGVPVERSETVQNPFLFTGREFDPETGLYFYRARYYDPQAGRFLVRDPAGFEGGENLYVYGRENPQGYTDPEGLLAEPLDIALVGLDLIEFIADPTKFSGGILIIDVSSLLVPGLPAPGLLAKANKLGKLRIAASDFTKLRQLRKDVVAVINTIFTKFSPCERGRILHKIFGEGKGFEFMRTIDNFVRETGTAISIKTSNIVGRTVGQVESRVMGAAHSLQQFGGAQIGKIKVAAGDVKRRMLIYVTPSAANSPKLRRAFDTLTRKLQGLGIDLVVPMK